MSNHSLPTLAERTARGKKMRDAVRRVDQGHWKAKPGRDPLKSIEKAETGRLPHLLPEKMKRMKGSPFAFFRGTASLMAQDLATTAVTGLTVQMCGDAHVCNLGAYAAPDGHLVFDINDFDESIPGPWEWDLKRMAASVMLAAGEAGQGDRQGAAAVRRLVQVYRESMATFARMNALELAQYQICRLSRNRVVSGILQQAERSTPLRNLQKLTQPAPEGHPMFRHTPPLECVPKPIREQILKSLAAYRDTVSAGRQLILDAYHPVDVAFKVVGTGSVGTRDYVVLLFGRDAQDPLLLQVKEELPSCYTPYLREVPAFKHQGRRVAEGQQRMQTFSDPLLGWTTVAGRPYLVRQLADHKAGLDPADLKGDALPEYASVCGEALAKAHARTGDAVALAAYVGDSPKLDQAIAGFATLYAKRVRQDFALFLKAIKSGRIEAAA